MRVVRVDLEGEQERPALVHTFEDIIVGRVLQGGDVRTLIGGDGEREVQEISGIREGCDHC